MAAEAKTIRVDDETYARFREIASTEFNNQGMCLQALVDNYDLAKQRTSLPGREVEIDTFQLHALELVKMYTQSLQIYQETEALVRSAVEREMTGKDRHIAELQDKLQAATEAREQLQAEVSAAQKSEADWRDEAMGLEEDLRQKQKEFDALLNTKDQLIAEKQSKINSLTDIITKLEHDQVEQERALAGFATIDQKYKALDQELAELRTRSEAARAQAELEQEKLLLAKEKEKQEAVQAVREEAYQQQQQQSARIDKLRDEVDELRKALSKEERK